MDITPLESHPGNSQPSGSQAADSQTAAPPPTVAYVAEGEWHALDRGLVVGSGDASYRPDGRLFVSIDTWHPAAFGLLGEAMLAALPEPLYTVVDEDDTELAAAWQRLGFAVRRHEREFTVPTGPDGTGLTDARPPSGVRILPVGAADEGLLRELDTAIRAEVEAGPGWHSMPAEILPRRAGDTIVDPSRYAVAATEHQYVGLLRLTRPPRRPRIGLLAVRAEEQRRGIARALLGQVLGALAEDGITEAYAEVDETNHAALALFEGIGSRRNGGILELKR